MATFTGSVEELPKQSARGKPGRWMGIWEAVERAAPDWAEIMCTDDDESSNLRNAANTHRTLRMEVRKRGLKVYLRLISVRGPR